MFRLEAQSRIKKYTRSSYNDSYFPFSPNLRRYVKNKTLNHVDAACLDPPASVVRALTYGRIRENITGSEGSLAQVVSNVLLPPDENPDANNDHAIRQRRVEWMRQNAEHQIGSSRRYQNLEEPWRCVSLADLDYELGFVNVIPDGCVVRQIHHQPQWQDRPTSEFAVFDNQLSDAEDLFRPREQNSASEFLAVPEFQAFHWGGCGQRELTDGEEVNYCCSAVGKRQYDTDFFSFRQNHRTAVLNQQIECPRNRHVVTHLHNLNVNRLVPMRESDNEQHYIHTFSFAPIQKERANVIDEVINHESYLRPDLSLEEIVNSFLSEWEIGFLAPHSALEISLDKDQQQRLCNTTQSFKHESPAFLHHENRLVENYEIKGPALPSPSQLYEMGTYRLLRIDSNRWGEDQVEHAPDMELPRSHQAFRNITDTRLNACPHRLQMDGEMAMPSFSEIKKDLEEDNSYPLYHESSPAERQRQEASEAK